MEMFFNYTQLLKEVADRKAKEGVFGQIQYGWGYNDGDGEIHKFQLIIPKPKKREVLLKIHAVGLCQSDNHLLQAGPILSRDQVKFPTSNKFIMRHEIAGSVEEVGEELTENNFFKKGARFALTISNPCNQCLNCRIGKDNSCLKFSIWIMQYMSKL